MDRRDFIRWSGIGFTGISGRFPLRTGAGEGFDGISQGARDFHAAHPVCDMLGLNLNHPRLLVDGVDLGRRHPETCRGDFPKFKEWGISLVVCKGGVGFYDDEYASLWRAQPGSHPDNPEPLYLTMSVKNPTQLVLTNLDRFLGHVENNRGQVTLVRRFADIEQASAERKVALLMGANRSDWFGDSLGVLRMFARLGLRMMTLGQATRELGYDPYNETRSGGRMTELGVRVLKEMNRLGILIDISHLSDACALDAIDVSERPVVASHSNPRELDPGRSPRAISDRLMKALADRGGVLGLMPLISRPQGERPLVQVPRTEMEATVKMIRYAVDRMGPESVGIGTHFSTTFLPWVTDGLLRSGFSEKDVAGIMGANYLRVLRQVLPEQAAHVQ